MLVLVSNPETEPLLMQYASALARARQGEVTALHLTSPQAHLPGQAIGSEFWKAPVPMTHGVPGRSCCALSHSTSDGVRAFTRNWPYALWVMGWFDNDDKRREMTEMAQRMDVPILVVRKGSAKPKPRILVATAGGIHALETIKIGADLSIGLGAEIDILRIVPRHMAPASTEQLNAHCREVAETMKLELRLAGMDHLCFRVCVGENVVADLASQSKRYDTLIVGGPSEWRLGEDIAGSIPDELARAVSCTLMMVIAPQHRELTLRRLLWAGTICADMPRLPYGEAITALVDRLVAGKQLPGQLRDRAIEAALNREQIEPTTVGCGVAIPHAALGNFTGTVAALGISPDGAGFGKEGDDIAHLVFLLITSADTYDTYLPVLSQVAHLVLSEKRRAELISAGTALRAAAVIQKFQEDVVSLSEPAEDPLESAGTLSNNGKE